MKKLLVIYIFVVTLLAGGISAFAEDVSIMSPDDYEMRIKIQKEFGITPQAYMQMRQTNPGMIESLKRQIKESEQKQQQENKKQQQEPPKQQLQENSKPQRSYWDF